MADFRLTDKVVARFFGDYQLREIRGLLLLRRDAAGLHGLRLAARPDPLHALPGARLPFLAPYEPQPDLHLREVPARRDARLPHHRAGGAPAPWREWNQELKATGRHVFQAFGREQPLQGGYEHRSERLERGTLSAAQRHDPERGIDVGGASRS